MGRLNYDNWGTPEERQNFFNDVGCSSGSEEKNKPSIDFTKCSVDDLINLKTRYLNYMGQLMSEGNMCKAMEVHRIIMDITDVMVSSVLKNNGV